MNVLWPFTMNELINIEIANSTLFIEIVDMVITKVNISREGHDCSKKGDPAGRPFLKLVMPVSFPSSEDV